MIVHGVAMMTQRSPITGLESFHVRQFLKVVIQVFVMRTCIGTVNSVPQAYLHEIIIGGDDEPPLTPISSTMYSSPGLQNILNSSTTTTTSYKNTCIYG